MSSPHLPCAEVDVVDEDDAVIVLAALALVALLLLRRLEERLQRLVPHACEEGDAVLSRSAAVCAVRDDAVADAQRLQGLGQGLSEVKVKWGQ